MITTALATLFLLAASPATFDPNGASSVDFRTQCVLFLQLSEQQLAIDNYEKLLQKCIDDRQYAKDNEIQRARINARAKVVADRLKRNSRAVLHKFSPDPEDAAAKKARLDAIAKARLDALQAQKRNASVRTTIKPNSSQAQRAITAKQYRENWMNAVQACSAIEKDADQQNCVREYIRQAGEK